MKGNPKMATAYHEAGHAVVAWLLGIPVKRVTIIPNKKENCDGECSHAKILLGKFPECDDSPRAHVNMQKHVMVCVAGIIAQRLFKPQSVRGYHSHSDYQSAVSIALSHCGSDKETGAFLSWLEVKTESLLRQPWNWAMVKLIATQLLACGTLKADEVAELLFADSNSPKKSNV